MNRRIIQIISVIAFLSSQRSVEGAQLNNRKSLAGTAANTIIQQEVINPGGLNYLLFLPQDTSQQIDGKFPLLISLHGIGERGTNLQILKQDGLPKILDGYNSFPFIVISPQCPTYTEWYWHGTHIHINKIIDDAIKLYPVDEKRIYITGYSMGGIGAYDMAIRYPEKIAAIVPIAARAEPDWDVCKMNDVPVWAFHGVLDYVVPLSKGQEIVNSLITCGANVKLTVYSNAGHDAWTRTYKNPAMYDWLLSHTKGKTSAIAARYPYVVYGFNNEIHVEEIINMQSIPKTIAVLKTENQVEDLAITQIGGEEFIVAIGGSTMAFINIRNIEAPELQYALNIGASCKGLAINDQYAYIAAGDSGLLIYSIAEIENPLLASAMDSLGTCESIKIDSTVAFVAAGKNSYILDITDPNNPEFISRIDDESGYDKFVNAHNGFLYICDYEKGLQIFDIANLQQPVDFGVWDTGYRTAKIIFQGNFGYIANGDLGMRVIEVSNIQAHPENVSLFDTPGRATSLCFGEIPNQEDRVNHVFVADGTAGFRAINISDPYSPTESCVQHVAPPPTGTDIKNRENIAPEKFELMQNYPNPFNPVTIIRYNLPTPAHVKLEIFNTMGQRLKLLVDEQQSPGFYQLLFQGRDLANGVYMYRLTAGEFWAARKFLILK